MSNTIGYDPLLVRYLADELNSRLRGRRITAAPLFASDLSVTLRCEGGETLRFDLHPSRGWARLIPSEPGESAELDAECTGVSAPPDERILRIGLSDSGRFQSQERTLVIELHTNQWNAILVAEDDRIVSLLRGRRAGSRALFPGERYALPGAQRRYGLDADREEAFDVWKSELAEVEPAKRRGRLLGRFAWTGATNADWIIGAEGSEASLADAFGRWWWLRGMPEPHPCLLRLNDNLQPYPVRLGGIPAEAAASLRSAMAAAAEQADAEAAPAVDPRQAAALTLARDRKASAERKLERLTEQLGRTGDAEVLRNIGDLLLARLHEVPKGASSTSLEDWEGNQVELDLDPQLAPPENAARYYDRAGRLKRAEEQLPSLIEAAEEEIARWSAAVEEVEGGDTPGWLFRQMQRSEQRSAAEREPGPALPYRTYRTSGGLEVRVGRNSRDNDRLTFHSSSPNDVWLHARSVPGSHVILRWADVGGAPPARDLAEAAQIAAVFSRARTSGVVAVDWTRRKHVRKPRGAPPGAVVPQQVKTLFVEPDETAVARMQERE
ncbi:MAG: NFACT family protein [Gemmatimonadota bacterium]